MKTAILFLGLVASSLATTLDLDWTKIKPKNIVVEPTPPLQASQNPNGPSTRVIGGNIAAQHEAPWQVGLIMDGAGFCGGSVISPDWILTAAHCTIDASSVQVIAGSNIVRGSEINQVVRVSNIIVNHEEYNRPVLNADISLVRLLQPLVYSNAIQPVILAASNAPDYAGARARLFGWGLTSDSATAIADHLMTVELEVITNLRCYLRFLFLVRDNNICTSGEGSVRTVGACNGDSGSALVIGQTQIGIVSFGAGISGCEGGAPTVYSRVSSHRDWVSRNAGV